MCECLEYDDGSRFLCPMCHDIVKDHERERQRLLDGLTAAREEIGSIIGPDYRRQGQQDEFKEGLIYALHIMRQHFLFDHIEKPQDTSLPF